MQKPFEMDVDPETRWPRARFNFSNGWSASILFRGTDGAATIASLAAWPTMKKGMNHTEFGQHEASPEEVAAFLCEIAARNPA